MTDDKKQKIIRGDLIGRCKSCKSSMPYGPFVLADVIAYLECEEKGDWSGWNVPETETETLKQTEQKEV